MNTVLGLLKSYPDSKRRIEQLRYELEHSQIISEHELIEHMALGSHTVERINGGHVSDRTMAIALKYKDSLNEIERETIIDINRELHILETEVDRLEYYVSLLEKKEADVIRALYFVRKSWEAAVSEMHISRQTLIRRRKRAIGVLESMYSLHNSLITTKDITK